MEVIETVTTVESKNGSLIQTKAMTKESEWRIGNIPPYVEPTEIPDLNQYNQQQSTQQAQKYKSTKFNPLKNATWQPGEP